jgi:hypothetical protein
MKKSAWAEGQTRVLGAAMLLAGITSCSPLDTDTVYSAPGTTTTIYLVRHAERDDGLDPPLNAEGLTRAIALADELEDTSVTDVFYPEITRNRQTAEPLVERVGMQVHAYGTVAAADTKGLANTFVDDVVRDYSGRVVLWIGNTGPVTNTQSGNLQEIYNRLGGTGSPPIRYADLYKVTLTEDEPPVIETGTYGGPSSLD